MHLAEEELNEARRQQQLIALGGDSDVDSEYGSDVGSEISRGTAVLYPLSFFDPFSYMCSTPAPVPPSHASRNTRLI